MLYHFSHFLLGRNNKIIVVRGSGILLVFLVLWRYRPLSAGLKQLVSWVKFSLSWSPFFVRDREQNFIPNLLQRLEGRVTKLHVYKMADAVHRKRTRKTCAQKKILFQLLCSF